MCQGETQEDYHSLKKGDVPHSERLAILMSRQIFPRLVNIFREKYIWVPSLLIYSSNCNAAHFGFQYIAF